jgi:hypothetical protein
LKHQNKSQEYYAIKCRLPPFAFESFVWLEDQTPASQGLRSKLRRKFIGSFGIVKLTSDKTYWLVNSTKISSIRDFKRADAKRLKHYSRKDNKIVKVHKKNYLNSFMKIFMKKLRTLKIFRSIKNIFIKISTKPQNNKQIQNIFNSNKEEFRDEIKCKTC